jgi:hypothetical protein
MLGERAWYIPGWLDRLLPDVFIEPPWEHDAAVPVPAEPAEVAARS